MNFWRPKTQMIVVSTVIFALSAAAYLRRWASVRHTWSMVAPDMRNPLLPLLAGSTTSDRGLARQRRLLRIATPLGKGVVLAKRILPTDAGVLAHVIAPAASTHPLRPAILWLHGGGMIAGSPQLEHSAIARMVRQLDIVVVSPDYQLSPEHVFPAALDDCMATLNWMLDFCEELGIDRRRVAVMGTSAGGGLAAAVAQRGTDEGIALRAQVLISPMIDDRTALRDDGWLRRFLWTAASNRYAWTAYLGRKPETASAPEYAAPARRVDLSNLPSAWIGVGDLDLFCDEAINYTERLRAAGVACELVVVPGMYHGAEGLAPNSTAVRAMRNSITDYMRVQLAERDTDGR